MYKLILCFLVLAGWVYGGAKPLRKGSYLKLPEGVDAVRYVQEWGWLQEVIRRRSSYYFEPTGKENEVLEVFSFSRILHDQDRLRIPGNVQKPHNRVVFVDQKQRQRVLAELHKRDVPDLFEFTYFLAQRYKHLDGEILVARVGNVCSFLYFSDLSGTGMDTHDEYVDVFIAAQSFFHGFHGAFQLQASRVELVQNSSGGVEVLKKPSLNSSRQNLHETETP